jgi:exonuclease SbcD
MIKILHCADVHLSSSDEKTKKYCLLVLDEIVEHAKEHSADYLIFAGDVFNTYKDVAEMKVDFRSRMKNIPDSCEVIFVAGNHEYLYSGIENPKISANDLGVPSGNVIEHSKDRPFTLLKRGGLEFFAIPHHSEYSSYVNWEIPEKENYRICIAHAQVSGLNFEGISDQAEENTSLIDPDVFNRIKADYVAMGHIHNAGKHKLSGCDLSYPGSARVWRNGEYGERKVDLITIDEQTKNIKLVTPVIITSAGQYRRYELPLDLDGGCSEIDEIWKEWGPNDCVEIMLEGVVDDENEIAKLYSSIESRFEKKVRELTVKRDDVFAVTGIAEHPIAKKFIEIWKTGRPDFADAEGIKAWLKARQIGLTEIKNAMEALQ